MFPLASQPVIQLLAGSMRDLNELSANLSPHMLYEVGLKSALEGLGEELSKEHGFRFVISGDETDTMGEDLRVTLFQIVRELLINVVKHAEASQVNVFITQDATSLSIQVVDDGVGFDLTSCKEGFGLAYIRQKVKFTGGTIDIQSAPGKGTRVIIEMPIARVLGLGIT